MKTNEISGAHPPRALTVDTDEEIAYWVGYYRALRPELRIEDYLPALKLGLDAYLRGQGQLFEDVTYNLQVSYIRVRGDSQLEWVEAFPVAMAVWNRLSERHARENVAREQHLEAVSNLGPTV
jgi:hypothetical protein